MELCKHINYLYIYEFDMIGLATGKFEKKLFLFNELKIDKCIWCYNPWN